MVHVKSMFRHEMVVDTVDFNVVLKLACPLKVNQESQSYLQTTTNEFL